MTLKLLQATPVAAVLLVAAAGAPALSQSTPPIVAPGTATAPSAGSSPPSSATSPSVETQAADSNVWNWQDVPNNQQIVIDRAVFDQGGYQLYCHTGEIIVVPFANQNLYVMKFGQCDGPMYFTTDGATPVLYVPFGGYLENATAAGAKWYPFPRSFDYLFPIYIGPAPSWDEYASMGWYPGMVYYGGYWGNAPYTVGLVYAPTPGYFVSIDGFELDGWLPFHDYVASHPSQRRFVHDQPGYRYDRFPRRGPEAIGAGKPFGSLNDVRPAVAERTPHSNGLANPAFQVHGDYQPIPLGARLGNPSLARPATAEAVQLASLKTRPVILGNPSFRAHEAVAALTPERSKPAVNNSALTLAGERRVSTDGAAMSSKFASPQAFLHGSGIAKGGLSPNLSANLNLGNATHTSPTQKSSGIGRLLGKAFKAASGLAHSYIDSKGNDSHGGHSDHADHPEKEERPVSGGEKKK